MRTIANTLVVSLLAAVAALPASAQSAADPTGHWEGTISAPMGQVDFEVDVLRDSAGHLRAAYGQKATGARGLPLTDVVLAGRTFTFVLFGGGAGGGAFKAEILADGKSMSGEASAPIGSAPFVLYRTGEAVMPRVITNGAVTTPLAGRWAGSLDVGGRQVGLLLTIVNRVDGSASVLIAQAAQPNAQVEAALQENGTAVSLDIPAASSSWAGTMHGGSLVGTWTQAGGVSFPLTFAKAQ